MTPDELRAWLEALAPGRSADVWDAFVAFVAEWITDYGPYDDDGDMARAWRAEMDG